MSFRKQKELRNDILMELRGVYSRLVVVVLVNDVIMETFADTGGSERRQVPVFLSDNCLKNSLR